MMHWLWVLAVVPRALANRLKCDLKHTYRARYSITYHGKLQVTAVHFNHVHLT